MVRGKLFILAVAAALLPGCPPAAPPSVATPSRPKVVEVVADRPTRDASDDLFEQDSVLNLKIELSDAQAQLLREDARRYSRARLIENDVTNHGDVAIKLKGAAGSFQDLDGKPGFTLNMDRYQKEHR